MAVKRIIGLAGLALLTLALVACENQQERYFRRNVNRVSQDAVAKQFGPPHRAQELTTGETVWAYESRQKSDCTAYILRFDRRKSCVTGRNGNAREGTRVCGRMGVCCGPLGANLREHQPLPTCAQNCAREWP
jgi:hypothetical protein